MSRDTSSASLSQIEDQGNHVVGGSDGAALRGFSSRLLEERSGEGLGTSPSSSGGTNDGSRAAQPPEHPPRTVEGYATALRGGVFLPTGMGGEVSWHRADVEQVPGGRTHIFFPSQRGEPSPDAPGESPDAARLKKTWAGLDSFFKQRYGLGGDGNEGVIYSDDGRKVGEQF